MEIGQNIQKLRKAAGMTQEELARVVGVAQPTIAQYERGSKIPTLIMGQAIAGALGVGVEDLVQTRATS